MALTEEEIRLIHSVWKREIPREQFKLLFRPTVADKQPLILDLLRRACDKRDGNSVAYALFIGFIFGFDADQLPVLCELAKADFHTAHEDVISALDQLRDERAIPTLYDAALAKIEYLNYDEFFALARKAVWALADIGTESAMEKLRLIRDGDNPVKAEYARDQLRYLEAGQKPLRTMP